MQLKIQRSQRMGGVMGSTVHFCLDVRADYSRDEAANIAKYKLGKQVVYNSRKSERHLEAAGTHLARAREPGAGNLAAGLARGAVSLALSALNLNISIDSLGKGQHIECKDLAELMEAEEAVMQACRNVRDYLALAATFNGSTILVDFTQKDEQVHTAMGGEVYARPPSSLGPTTPSPAPAVIAAPVTDAVFEEMPAQDSTVDYAPGTIGAEFGDAAASFEPLWQEVRAFYDKQPMLFWIVGAAAASVFVLKMLGGAALAVLLAVGLPVGLAALLLRR